MAATSSEGGGAFEAGRGAPWVGDAVFVVVCFLASRAALEIVGLSSAVVLRPHLDYAHVWTYSDRLWLAIWGVADTGWYLDIARDGYDHAVRASGPVAGQANWAFFPAYPMIAAALARTTGWSDFTAMVVLSNVCLLAALAVLSAETTTRFGAAAGRWVVVLTCVLPGSYVFSAAYTESLHLLLLAVFFALLRRRRWWGCGAVAGLAALTRNIGVVLVLPMLVVGLGDAMRARRASRGAPWREGARAVGAAVMPVAALAAFCLYLWTRTGDPLAFASIQKAWGRELQVPFAALVAPMFGHGALDPAQALNWIAAVVSIVGLAVLAAEKRWDLFAYAVVAVLLPLAYGPGSLLRFAIADAPLLMAAAGVCARRPTWAPVAVASAAVLDGFMMVSWSIGLPMAH